MGLFQRNKKYGQTQVPVWFMRQAGRYHDHYQGIRKKSDFMTMCKTPELAHEITMGPIDSFHFDAAILFSDLLFPLEHLELGLSYQSGPPTLETQIDTREKIDAINPKQNPREFYDFQRLALLKLKDTLPENCSLLGFVGAPFTLYTYATEGSHKGFLNLAKTGLYDGRFKAFMEKLLPSLETEMEVQAAGNPDAICLFDTAAGELCLKDYTEIVLPYIHQIAGNFKTKHPHIKLLYYSKMTHSHYLEELDENKFDVVGIDWRMDLSDTLKRFSSKFMIQGNIDPSWLHLSWEQLERNLKWFWDQLDHSPELMNRWVCGLGHGVTVGTPQDNVRKTVEFIHQNFRY